MIEGARVVVGVDGSLSSPAAVRRAAAEARGRDAVLVPVIAWMACDGDSPRPLSELEFAARVRLDGVVEPAVVPETGALESLGAEARCHAGVGYLN